MDKLRRPNRGRKFGSNRWKQARSMEGNVPTYPISEEEPFHSEIMEKIQEIFQEHDGSKEGFITREDMQKLEGEVPWSTEELQLLFDGLDADNKGYIATGDFTAGLRHILSSQIVTREHRKRKTASVGTPRNLSLVEANIEEQKHFKAFINQLGADNIFEDPSEIWRIWVQLRKDEPDLLENLKEFLAKMTHLIKEAKHAKEMLQLTLEMRVVDHNREVQQLYEEMEQQIEREKQRLQYESKTRSQLYSMEMKKVLDIKEQEIHHFLGIQKELETQLLTLREKQHVVSTQTQELKQTNSVLENQLQETLCQLQQTQRHLGAMTSRISQLQKEDRGKHRKEDSNKTLQSPQEALSTPEMDCSRLEMHLECSLDMNALDSSTQQPLDDVASMSNADSESRTRVISLKEDPVANSTRGGEQYFPQEPSGQSSLFKEMNEAVALLRKVSELHHQQIDDFGVQGQESMDQIRQSGNSQKKLMQEKIPLKEALSKNDCPEKRISEIFIGEARLQGEILLKEGPTHTQASGLEMKQNNPRVEAKTPEPMVRGSLIPKAQPSTSSGLMTDVRDDYKEGLLPGDTLALEQLSQPEHYKQVLKYSSIIQNQPLSTSSEQGVIRLSPEMKMPDKQTPETPHSLVKDVGPPHFPTRLALPIVNIVSELKSSFVQNSQLNKMPEPEKQVQNPEGLEILSSEHRREGKVKASECKKNQEVRVVPNEETKVRPDDKDCQMTVNTKGISKATKALSSQPDHVYNVLFVGNTNVGKTSFLCRLQENSFQANVTATIGVDYRIKNLFVDDKCFTLQLWDTAGQERYHSLTKQFFRKADGVVLMYDITSEYSFADVRYWLNNIQVQKFFKARNSPHTPCFMPLKEVFSKLKWASEHFHIYINHNHNSSLEPPGAPELSLPYSKEGAGNGVIVLLLGNKTDCAAERRVSVEDGEYLAKEYGFSFYECSAASGHNVTESMVTLVRLLKADEDRLKQEVLELSVIPKKKSKCCS